MSDAIKKQLRAQMNGRRSRLTLDERRDAARAISAEFLGNIPIDKTDVIAGFWPMEEECDIRLLLESLEEEGYRLCLPVVQEKDKPLLFREYKRGDVLVPDARFGVQQPHKNAKPITPNVIMVPLLAVDQKGNRLGYGGGFYDRTLSYLQTDNAVNKRLLTVGIAYSFQLIETVPTHIHDQPIDCVVTDAGVTIFAES